jgi:hypothetical protein
MKSQVNLFHVGPQKTGSTWLYRSLSEHKSIYTIENDTVHFFDIFYFKGIDWYHSFFSDSCSKILYDPTVSYFRDKQAPERIYNYNPDAKIMFTARNPLERAFSHYWHEKKKGRFNFTFDEVFQNYDLFTNWLEPGLYALHLEKWLQFFPKEQIKVLFFDDLEENPSEFLKDVLDFCNLDTNFTPSVLEKKLNVAGYYRPYKQYKLRRKLISSIPGARFIVKPLDNLITKKHKEKLEDFSMETKQKVIDFYYEDICKLENHTERDLSHWKKIF